MQVPQRRTELRSGRGGVHSRPARPLRDVPQQHLVENHCRQLPADPRAAARLAPPNPARRMLDTTILAPRLRRWLGAIALAACALGAAGSAAARGPQPGQFDYYALALSWSPTYCGSNSGQHDAQQCGRGRRYGFVLHGLWPQWQRGWPEFCATGSSWLAEDIVRRMLDIMPSRQLVIHEWKKHGTCSGLDQQAYFALARRLFSLVQIPARYRSPRGSGQRRAERSRRRFCRRQSRPFTRHDGGELRQPARPRPAAGAQDLLRPRRRLQQLRPQRGAPVPRQRARPAAGAVTR